MTYIPDDDPHELVLLKRKPSASIVQSMVEDYFDAHSDDYDLLTQEDEGRKLLSKSMVNLIAEDIKQDTKIKRVLSVGGGTGLKEEQIRKSTKAKLDFTLVDLSAGMLSVAKSRGFKIHTGPWLSTNFEDSAFDAALCLYTFFHIPTKELRLQFLQKIAQYLNTDGVLYINVYDLEGKGNWPRAARETFSSNDLEKAGYEPGDLFYRWRNRGLHLCFMHYFQQTEINDLLNAAGFQILWQKNVGTEELQSQEGIILLKAKKSSIT